MKLPRRTEDCLIYLTEPSHQSIRKLVDQFNCTHGSTEAFEARLSEDRLTVAVKVMRNKVLIYHRGPERWTKRYTVMLTSVIQHFLLSADGNTLVIQTLKGIDIYTCQQGRWGQTAHIAHLGYRMSISANGHYLAVCDKNIRPGCYGVYLYTTLGENWIISKYLPFDTKVSQILLSAYGNRLVVRLKEQKQVSLFRREGADWTHETDIAIEKDDIGKTMAANEAMDVIALSSEKRGKLHILTRKENQWKHKRILTLKTTTKSVFLRHGMLLSNRREWVLIGRYRPVQGGILTINKILPSR